MLLLHSNLYSIALDGEMRAWPIIVYPSIYFKLRDETVESMTVLDGTNLLVACHNGAVYSCDLHLNSFPKRVISVPPALKNDGKEKKKN